MTKFDHRLKRLEGKTGLKKKDFDYWIVSSSPATGIRDIAAGKVPGKMGSRFDPESKNVIIVSAVPRPIKRASTESARARQQEISFAKTIDVVDLTDEELKAEIASIEKELAK